MRVKMPMGASKPKTVVVATTKCAVRYARHRQRPDCDVSLVSGLCSPVEQPVIQGLPVDPDCLCWHPPN